MPRSRIVTVFGASGFLGSAVVGAFARAGWRVKAACRRPEAGYALRPLGTPGQVEPVPFMAGDRGSTERALAGAQTAVNCVGTLHRGLAPLNADLPGLIGAAARAAGVERFVHVSALGVQGGPSRYAASKLWGESAAREAFGLDTTVLRPSVIFGPGDRFFALFARLSALFPALPLVGGGGTRFQPVYVGDVARAALQALDVPPETYSLGGPEAVTFRQVLERVCTWTGRRRALVPLPWALAKAQGAVLQFLPGTLLTPDMVDQLRADSVVPDGAPGLAALGVAHPTPMEAIVPGYLSPTAKALF
ncbi:MAG TPA: complex I NDUFA9 subunit family protein [Rhodospirillaceae bacterium]|jgi:uncharacterized protein YbjT (DUF2867 family)|nr:complex I NDUFA9 subunit family protein [Alphaproteobacteria bacterium]HBH25877.1 complex I NDUFA9 subunit family protein [Rhodospirillaceae bacterium]